MRGVSAFAFLSLLGRPVAAAAPTVTGTDSSSPWADDGPLCMQSCKNSLWRVPFGDVAEGTRSGLRACSSRLELRSTFICLGLYCLPEARDIAYGELRETCLAQEGVSIPSMDIVAGYTREQIDEMDRIYRNDTFAPGDKVDRLLIPASAHFAAWYTTLVRRFLDCDEYAVVWFWVLVVAFGAGYRLFTAIAYKLSPKIPHTSVTGLYGSATRWLRRKVLLPATFGHRCAQSIWWCTIPPRIQTLTLAAFAVINIFFCVHGYRLTAVNLYFPSKEQQIFRYVSDRTGIVSYANFPAIWLFGMRNNVALWLTGWDFGTYNNFHRWVARISTAQAVVHSVGYTVLILRHGGWSSFAAYWTRWWWCAGEIATVVMCLLLACSVYWMRRQKYELFLILHIIMSVIILATMLGHVSIFDGSYDGPFWTAVVLWLLDRALRLARVLAFKPKSWSTRASVTYDASSNIVRLLVPTEQKIYKVHPGTFYYLSILDVARSWESHPFTVATVRPGYVQAEQSGQSEQAEEARLIENSADAQDVDETEGKVASNVDVMTFLIRPYDSFTERLKHLAAEKQEASAVRVLVDGPYGHKMPLERFSHIVFIVGGSGIVLPLSYIDLLTGKAPDPPYVDIHWAVREPAFARDILRNDMKEVLENNGERVSVNLHGLPRGHDVLQGVSTRVEENFGRPDVHGIVRYKIAEQGIESLAVVACGPAGMADDARKAVVDALEHSPFSIHYFEEHFAW
ncbi:ferric-chelate reductase [Cordyceps fumosorosea ARSEF 2679]|uniref:Ferric-chelate reductase n=1 Tax=Cordyceps fumosorosea (strain ARSEF 2679) TaxID=1081104 RepID=A0A167NNC8_CORFA|nr:ferric-chelate reductase [Cordyceps fumosorosea ARSEF 2679]OAA55748.1 ferric-chelate reductase [Cordyceps fumosorosea ARSEF 2679]